MREGGKGEREGERDVRRMRGGERGKGERGREGCKGEKLKGVKPLSVQTTSHQ